MAELSAKKCTPCEGGVAPLDSQQLQTLKTQLGGNWKVINEHHLEKEFLFKNFKEALAFTNTVGKIAEEENHHPDIHLAWGKVRIVLWTHKSNGLTENDFVLASKIDEAQTPAKST